MSSTLFCMVRRALTVLFAALAAACAGVVGFTEAPSIAQLVALIGACVFAAAVQTMDSAGAVAHKKDERYMLPQFRQRVNGVFW